MKDPQWTIVAQARGLPNQPPSSRNQRLTVSRRMIQRLRRRRRPLRTVFEVLVFAAAIFCSTPFIPVIRSVPRRAVRHVHRSSTSLRLTTNTRTLNIFLSALFVRSFRLLHLPGQHSVGSKCRSRLQNRWYRLLKKLEAILRLRVTRANGFK